MTRANDQENGTGATLDRPGEDQGTATPAAPPAEGKERREGLAEAEPRPTSKEPAEAEPRPTSKQPTRLLAFGTAALVLFPFLASSTPPISLGGSASRSSARPGSRCPTP
jgi:hypothetical protein